jgi:hypothetical protein
MPNAAPQRKPGEANPITQMAILVAILVAVANAGFYFMSESYFQDRVGRFGIGELDRLDGARVDFAIFTIVIGLGAIAVTAYPRWVAISIPTVAGLLSFVAAVAAINAGLSIPLIVTLLLASVLFDLLVWHAIAQKKKSRAAWASLVAMCLVFGIVTLFGAPKLRGMFGVGLWIAMIVPGAFGVGVAALRSLRADYREQG